MSVTAIAMGPTFDVPVVNVTVVVGQTAMFPCFIQHLGRHKVHICSSLSFDLYTARAKKVAP